jgi:hypothetical protein
MTKPRALPPIAGSMLTGIYEHRLLSTTQLHALYTPAAQPRWARQVLALLELRGFVDRIRSPRRLSLWFLTDTGADAVEAGGARVEFRRRVTSREQSRQTMRQRVQRTLALQASDPAGRAGQITVSFVALDGLSARGPFAPIFLRAQQPEQPVDWLGQPQPQEHKNDDLH